MAERIPQTRVTKNNNENRKKLKVRENPRYSKKHAIKIQQKKDRKMKMILSLFTIVIIVVLFSLTISKRSELVAKRDAYNELSNKTISTELKRDRLKAKLENSIDINRIQRYAIEELGMVYDKSSGEKIEFDGN
ncbi:hypothetical protein [uncultured Anaerococcus sp.]|uniref:hypothetical protein n=1 Tax=uncultured Anaerococcus sp. TaxID=293428 RepID=UPI00260B93A5|nr:hypothetical protein [uncultured Anaerococcus sp.]